MGWDDVTRLVDLYPGTSVAPFWEVDTDAPAVLLTPLELMQQLEEAGYRLSYRRIPLSRERTPEAADVDALHSQLAEAPAATAEAGGGGGAVVHLSTPTGSSARFVAALAGAYLSRRRRRRRPPAAARRRRRAAAWPAARRSPLWGRRA
ncbi:hypothetical protein GPECTOR_176g221 [Gonium pectorale]|uniref:Uncharacterized protein n=1 Tax=Gonium pectorale TaxID=33097 RepID=A0A150FYW2_GONPE|nr:hypothetical protein GPECTOR_176g221 [Gonium pectorale]|eukprot:KXZ42240.1 hypothetical protein GPECTOR_176g221 [Gonium pectorale]